MLLCPMTAWLIVILKLATTTALVLLICALCPLCGELIWEWQDAQLSTEIAEKYTALDDVPLDQQDALQEELQALFELQAQREQERILRIRRKITSGTSR